MATISPALDLASLYEEYAADLRRYCQSILRNPEEAADAAQQAWVRALERYGEQEGRPRSFEQWLFVVARNECFDMHRRRRRFAPLDDHLDQGSSVEETQERHEDVSAVLDDLERISARQRQAIVLRELRGLSYQEVASELHTNLDTARSLTDEARQALVARRSGRAEDCSTVRARLDHSRAPRQGHFMLGHLESCRGCTSYHAQSRRRARSLCVAPLLLAQRAFAAARAHLLLSAHGAAALAAVAVGVHVVAGVPLPAHAPSVRPATRAAHGSHSAPAHPLRHHRRALHAQRPRLAHGTPGAVGSRSHGRFFQREAVPSAVPASATTARTDVSPVHSPASAALADGVADTVKHATTVVGETAGAARRAAGADVATPAAEVAGRVTTVLGAGR